MQATHYIESDSTHPKEGANKDNRYATIREAIDVVGQSSSLQDSAYRYW